MIDIAALASAAAVCLAGAMSPGPNFVAVSHRATTGHRRDAMAFVCGVAVVNALWATITISGVSMLLAQVPSVLTVLRLLGSAYLVWFGVSLIRRAGQDLQPGASGRERPDPGSAFRSGMLTNLANPKSLTFYASVFSTVLPQDASVPTLMAMVSMVAMIAVLWYGAVAFVLSTQRIARAYRRTRGWLERFCGGLMIVFGIRQAVL